jgi:hypothetical protein
VTAGSSWRNRPSLPVGVTPGPFIPLPSRVKRNPCRLRRTERGRLRSVLAPVSHSGGSRQRV